MTIGLSAAPARSQPAVVHLNALETNKLIWISNVVFETNSTGYYEKAAMARVLLESYRANPDLCPSDALSQMNALQGRYDAATSVLPYQNAVSATEAVDTLLTVAETLPGAYGKGATIAKVAFDKYADNQLAGLGQ